MWGGISGFDLQLSNLVTSSIFSCVWWSSICLLWKNCLFRPFVYFLIEFFAFLPWHCMNSLYILDNNFLLTNTQKWNCCICSFVLAIVGIAQFGSLFLRLTRRKHGYDAWTLEYLKMASYNIIDCYFLKFWILYILVIIYRPMSILPSLNSEFKK